MGCTTTIISKIISGNKIKIMRVSKSDTNKKSTIHIVDILIV